MMIEKIRDTEIYGNDLNDGHGFKSLLYWEEKREYRFDRTE